MAGSFGHCVYGKDGKILPREEITELLDHLGDAYGALEEMFFMIDYLAKGNASKIYEAHCAFVHKNNPSYKMESFKEWMREHEENA